MGIFVLATQRSLGDSREILLSAACGLILTVSGFCFYAAVSWGRLTIVSPVSFAAIASLTFVVGLLRGERPSGLAVAGAVIIIPAVVLVSRPSSVPRALDHRSTARRLGLAGEWVLSVAAGGSFVAFQILLLEVGVDDGPTPLLIVRGVSAIAGIAVLAIIGASSGATGGGAMPRSAVLPTAVAGTLVVLSHALLIEALNRGPISVVGPVTALTPAFAVLGARLLLGEHVSRSQVVGMVATVAGLVMLGLR